MGLFGYLILYPVALFTNQKQYKTTSNTPSKRKLIAKKALTIEKNLRAKLFNSSLHF